MNARRVCPDDSRPWHVARFIAFAWLTIGAASAGCSSTDASPAGGSAGCANTASDPLNCGACGKVCATGLVCRVGVCSSLGGSGASSVGGGTASNAGSSAIGAAGAGGGTVSGAAGGTVNGVAGGTASGGASTGTGSGLQVGALCFPVCASAITDPDGDGYGREVGRSCVVAGSAPSVGASACSPPVVMSPVPPGNGYYVDGLCVARCASDATDPDPITGVRDGYGYEMGKSCIVAGSVPALQAFSCAPAGAATGDGYQVGALCVPACLHPELGDAQGYGYEAQQTCVVTGSMAALQNARCALQPRTLPPPGSGFLNGQTCFPTCGANATDLTVDGYGFDQNRSCVVAKSTAAIQAVPCVPPPSTVTGDCPRVLTCPVVNGVALTCGCTWVDGLTERKQTIMATAGASQYFVASAMMETATLTADYILGDGKTGDSFNAGICKQNWSMIRRCHPAYVGQTAQQFATSIALNTSLSLDVQVYNECRTMFGADWWSGHRGGFGNLGSTSQDVQQFKAAMDWINSMLPTHLADDVRFWVTIQAI